jgi:hypothetical protein
MLLPVFSLAIVVYCALLHAFEGLVLLNTTSADGSIGLHALLLVFPSRCLLAYFMLASSAAGIYLVGHSLLASRREGPTPPWAALLLLPQQWLLLITATGAWIAIANGAYADGVPRSSAFIAADQLPRAMFSVLHAGCMLSIADFYKRRHAAFLRAARAARILER